MPPGAPPIAVQTLADGKLELKRTQYHRRQRLAVIHATSTSKAKHWLTTDSLLDRVGEIVCAFPEISAAAINDEAFRFALASEPTQTGAPGSSSQLQKPVSLDVCGAAVEEESLQQLQWPLASFAGTSEDPDEHALNQLRLLQGDDDGLLFGFESEIDVVRFERMLRMAVMSARAATTTIPEPAVTAADGAAQTATPADSAKRQKRTEEPRVRAGQELREAIRKVAKLYGQKQMTAAKAALAEIPPGKAVGERSAQRRGKEMCDLLFTFGGLQTTKAALNSFLDHGEVKRLLSDDLLKAREEMADAKTATALLEAAKRYLTEMHRRCITPYWHAAMSEEPDIGMSLAGSHHISHMHV